MPSCDVEDSLTKHY